MTEINYDEILQIHDFVNPLQYKLYTYLISQCLHQYPENMHLYFTDNEIEILFNKAIICHPEIETIYKSGSILSGRYYNYIGMHVAYEENSSYRKIINNIPYIKNIYGKACALDTLLYNFSKLFTKDDWERIRPQEDNLYIVFQPKKRQLEIMDQLF